MGAAGDLGPHQGRLGAEAVGIYPLQVVPALVVIAVACGEVEVGGVHPVFLHGGDDLGLVELRHLVNVPELVCQPLQHLLAEAQHLIADTQPVINGIGIRHFSSFLPISSKICRATRSSTSGLDSTRPLSPLPSTSTVSPGRMS